MNTGHLLLVIGTTIYYLLFVPFFSYSLRLIYMRHKDEAFIIKRRQHILKIVLIILYIDIVIIEPLLITFQVVFHQFNYILYENYSNLYMIILSTFYFVLNLIIIFKIYLSWYDINNGTNTQKEIGWINILKNNNNDNDSNSNNNWYHNNLHKWGQFGWLFTYVASVCILIHVSLNIIAIYLSQKELIFGIIQQIEFMIAIIFLFCLYFKLEISNLDPFGIRKETKMLLINEIIFLLFQIIVITMYQIFYLKQKEDIFIPICIIITKILFILWNIFRYMIESGYILYKNKGYPFQTRIELNDVSSCLSSEEMPLDWKDIINNNKAFILFIDYLFYENAQNNILFFGECCQWKKWIVSQNINLDLEIGCFTQFAQCFNDNCFLNVVINDNNNNNNGDSNNNHTIKTTFGGRKDSSTATITTNTTTQQTMVILPSLVMDHCDTPTLTAEIAMQAVPIGAIPSLKKTPSLKGQPSLSLSLIKANYNDPSISTTTKSAKYKQKPNIEKFKSALKFAKDIYDKYINQQTCVYNIDISNVERLRYIQQENNIDLTQKENEINHLQQNDIDFHSLQDLLVYFDESLEELELSLIDSYQRFKMTQAFGEYWSKLYPPQSPRSVDLSITA